MAKAQTPEKLRENLSLVLESTGAMLSDHTLELLDLLVQSVELPAEVDVEEVVEVYPVINAIALRLSVTPQAIREHFESSSAIRDMADEELYEIGEKVLVDDLFYKDWHKALVAALEFEPDDDIDDEDGEEEKGDDLCDICMSSEVNVDRTTYCGKTIGIECGCEDLIDGTCGNESCEACKRGAAEDNADGENEEES